MFDLQRVIGALSNISVLAPITFYFLKIKSVPKSSHLIGILVITSFIFDAVGYIRFINKQPTVVLFNAYSLIQHMLLSVYFYKILFNKSMRFVFAAGIVVFAVGYIFIFALAQHFTEYQSYAWTLSSLVLAFYGCVYTSHQLRSPSLYDRHFQSVLFINAAIVIYFSFGFLMFVVDQYLLSSNPEIVGATWSFHNVNNTVKNIVLAIGLYYTGKSNIGPMDQKLVQ
jgi:hypothetical protein